MKLADWMEKHGATDVAVAAAIGVHRVDVRRMRLGEQGASLRTAARLQLLTKGKVTALDLDPDGGTIDGRAPALETA